MARRMPVSSARDVFCNFPFDDNYERLYIALVAALLCTGQTPRTVLEVPANRHRLARILDLIAVCPFSVHDLSNVRVSGTGRGTDFRVPRFNMPFELGLAVALVQERVPDHQIAILESAAYRLQHSLSDMNGYDPAIHHGTVDGMFGAICDVFGAAKPFPIDDAARFRQVYNALRRFRQVEFPFNSIYTRDRFARLVVAGREYVRQFS